MIAEALLDTNVVAYAASRASDDADKASRAREIIRTVDFGLSGQVLQEFYVTATRKFRVPLTHDEALDWLEQLEEFPCVAVDASLVYQGAETARRFQISYWDGTIIAAAARLGARTVYSEDLNDGQHYGAVQVVNPFKQN